MLVMKVNPRTKRKVYALVSQDKKKVLQYFGKARPSTDEVKQVEDRVEYFKNKGQNKWK